MRILNDLRKPVKESGQPSGASLMLSWSNLEIELRGADVIRPREVISQVVISEDGLTISVEKS